MNKQTQISVKVIYLPDHYGNAKRYFRVYCAGVAVLDYSTYPSSLIKGL